MAGDFDKFNPSVPMVDPGNYTDVTRPISRPEANVSKGTLFSALGTGLKDTGELVKDTTKLQDFTNKQDLSNRINLDLNAQRDRRIVELEQSNTNLPRVPAPGQPVPEGLKSLPGKVDAVAAMRAQQSQSDVYFRGRVDDLSKQYRAQFPQYRDYIDQVFSKAGFGEPANAYMSALERANLNITTALKEKTDKNVDAIRTHLPELGPEGVELMGRLERGEPEGPVMARYSKIMNDQFRVKAAQAQISLMKDQRESAVPLATTHVRDAAALDVENALSSPQAKADMAAMDNWVKNPGSYNEQQALLIRNRFQKIAADLTFKAQARDSIQHSNMTKDADGNDIELPGEKYSNTGLLGKDYAATVIEGHSHLHQILDQLEKGDYSLVKMTDNLNKARTAESTRYFMTGPFASEFAIMEQFKSVGASQWLSNYMQSLVGRPQVMGGKEVTFDEAMQGLVANHALAQIGIKPADVNEQLKRLNGEQAPKNPAVNRAILAPWSFVSKPDTPPQAKEALVQAHANADSNILDNMNQSNRVKHFADRTKPVDVESIKKLSPETFAKYKQWTEDSFNKIFVTAINDLPFQREQGTYAAAKYKIYWNDETHNFGVDPAPETRPAGFRNRGSIQNIKSRIDDINKGLTGLSNVAEAAGQDPNAYVVNMMKINGLTDNKFWDAVKAQEGSRVQPPKEAKKAE
jgi:hypothetical protein